MEDCIFIFDNKQRRCTEDGDGDAGLDDFDVTIGAVRRVLGPVSCFLSPVSYLLSPVSLEKINKNGWTGTWVADHRPRVEDAEMWRDMERCLLDCLLDSIEIQLIYLMKRHSHVFI